MTTKKAKALIKRVDDYLAQLGELVDDAARSEAVTKYLSTAAKFYNYSYGNQILILIQNSDATAVAGYRAWKEKFNRQVNKGEHGIKIVAPCKYKRKNLWQSDLEYDPESDEIVVRGFRIVTVFDVSQTEGDPLPDPPDWKSLHQDNRLDTLLIQFAKQHEIEVKFADNLGGAQGVSKGGSIVLAAEAGTKTLVHEIAHEILHRKLKGARLDRDTKELEAESVAYIVASHFEIPDLVSANYLALFHADSEKIGERLERIRSAACQIIEGVEKLEASNGHH